MKHVLLINNKDSFVFNLKAEFERLACRVTVVSNSVPLSRVNQWLERNQIDCLVYSPGPGRPEQSRLTLSLLKTKCGQYPMLGICLGMQAMGMAFGGLVGSSQRPLHGKATEIVWRPHGFTRALPSTMRASRYHSLVVTRMPHGFQEIASCGSLPMAMIDVRNKMVGLQFHPESILTEHGTQVLHQFLTFWESENGIA